jgi:NLI interacting factor-like phosphatase
MDKTKKKKTLILDLDETLAFRSRVVLPSTTFSIKVPVREYLSLFCLKMAATLSCYFVCLFACLIRRRLDG